MRRKGGGPRYGGRFAARELIEALTAEVYTARWHAVDDWAASLASSLPDSSSWPVTYARLALWRGSYVHDLDNEEEAYRKGRAPGEVEEDLWAGSNAPGRAPGGTRRVAIRAYSWIVDETAETAYDPTWITLGQGMSARTAWTAAQRWLRMYASAIVRGVESRLLTFAAIEIAFWTAKEGAHYV